MREETHQLRRIPNHILLISALSLFKIDWASKVINRLVVIQSRAFGNVVKKGLLLWLISGWTCITQGKDVEVLKTNNASIYHEVAGIGQQIIMIHAGVADSRQWNNEFRSFARNYRVIRYDMRGFGRSHPVQGEFSHLQDLAALLDHIQADSPVILLGCSMGGGQR